MTFPSFSPGDILFASDQNAVGLWKVATLSVTSGSVLAVDDCFTSDYDNYRVVVSNLKSTGNASLSLQLRDSGTPSATGYAFGQGFILFSSATWNLVANAGTGTAWAAPGNTNTNPPSNGIIEFFQPQKAERTGMTGHYQSFDAFIITAGSHNAGTNVYDGFQLTTAGTFTAGTVTVYGYRK
jgi:hypothetical protein